MRFAAIGRTSSLLGAASACAAAGHACVLVVAPGAHPAGAPAYNATAAEFKRAALALGCPLLCAPDLSEPGAAAAVRESGAEIAISVNWPTLIDPSTRELFPRGVLNAHAGDLPRFRGNACPNWAILLGEPAVVVCVHEMSDELDAGDVLLRRRFDLGPDTYVTDVYAWFDRALPELFAAALDGLAAGTIEPTPQPRDPGLALRCYPRRPEDGAIRWGEPAVDLARLVRASARPFAGAFSSFAGEKVIVWRARAVDRPGPVVGVPGQVVARDAGSGTVTVLAGEGFLVLEDVGFPDGWEGPPAVRVRSTRDRFADPLAGELEALRRRLARLEAERPGGA